MDRVLCKQDGCSTAPPNDQGTFQKEVKDEEIGMKIKEEEIPPDINTDLGETILVHRNVKMEEQETDVNIEEAITKGIHTDETDDRPERYLTLPYSHDSTEGDITLDRDIKEENLNVMVVDFDRKGSDQISVTIKDLSTNGLTSKINSEDHPQGLKQHSDVSTVGIIWPANLISHEKCNTNNCIMSNPSPSESGAGSSQGGASSPAKTKSGRNVRFTHAENAALVETVLRHYSELLGEDSSNTSYSTKRILWQQVIDAVNAVGQYKRSENSCRRRFSDIKILVKGKIKDERKAASQTGGGPRKKIALKDYEELMRNIISEELLEGVNIQDTDAPSEDVAGPSSQPVSHVETADDDVQMSSSEDLFSDEHANITMEEHVAGDGETDPNEEEFVLNLEAVMTPPQLPPSPCQDEPAQVHPRQQSRHDAQHQLLVQVAATMERVEERQGLFLTTHRSSMQRVMRAIQNSQSITLMGFNRLGAAIENQNIILTEMCSAMQEGNSIRRELNIKMAHMCAQQLAQLHISHPPAAAAASTSSADTSVTSTPVNTAPNTPVRRGARTRGGLGRPHPSTPSHHSLRKKK